MKMTYLIAGLAVILLLLCVVLVVVVNQQPAGTPDNNLNIVDTTQTPADDHEQTTEQTDAVETIPPVHTLPTEGEGSLFDEETGVEPTVGVDVTDTKPTDPAETTKPTEGTTETTKPNEGTTETTKPTEGEGDAETGNDPTEETADFVIDFDDLLNKKP